MKLVAYTRPDCFVSISDDSINYPYQRVAALWHDDGFFGEHIGERATRKLTPRELEIAPVLGRRLMASFRTISAGEEVNCHRFSRDMAGMPSSTSEPRTTPKDLQRVKGLAVGGVGLVGAENFGVPHSIGYGLDDESLQVMSSSGELGFAANTDIINFYRRLYPRVDIDLYELPVQV